MEPSMHVSRQPSGPPGRGCAVTMSEYDLPDELEVLVDGPVRVVR
jgi:hypothetical protein